jgi:hypothetical protein
VRRLQLSHCGGFALVITLITVALLTIIAVAFLASSSLDQTTARAFANKAKAQLAARTAVNTAIARLLDNVSNYSDSATSWEKVNPRSGGVLYEGTVLYYRDESPDATAGGIPAPLHALPLISGATAVSIPPPPQSAASRASTLAAALPGPLDNTNSFDLNHPRYLKDTQGAIGAPAGAASRPEFRAPWISQTDADGKVTSRYAYWMEDESFKANVNLMGVTPRGSDTVGDDPSEIPMQGLLKTLGIPNFDAVATVIFNSRSNFPGNRFFEYRAVDQAAPSPIADNAKFESTIFSGGLNLSRTGSKRINLNSTVSTSTDPGAIRLQLDQIINTIKYQSPNFGQRFYRPGSDKNSLDVPASDQAIYLNKTAANIRDYIDTDSQPTVIDNDGNFTVRIGSRPTNCFTASGGGTSGPNEVIAIGKERIPYIQEYALRVREISFGPRTGPVANYTIGIDHYVEIWNVTNNDIAVSDLGPNPFLLIADQPGWDAGGLDDIPEGPPRDLHLALSNAVNSATGSPLVIFPAGSCIVLTTDPDVLPALAPDKSKVYYIQIQPENLRTYSGKTQKKSGSNLRLNMRDRTTNSSDYETEIALANDLGMLESAWGAGAIGTAISVNIDNGNERLDQTKYHFRGASLRGNSGSSVDATTGDPRSNAEQLQFDLNGASAGTDKTRYYASGLGDNDIPGSSSLGAPNSNYVDPSKWPDYSSSNEAAADAPAVIANAKLTSIGQLGDIFDPVRVEGDSSNIRLSRSGGRTFRIGQPNFFNPSNNPSGLWDGDSNSASREWTAWRLADMFTTQTSPAFLPPGELEGLVNINGAARDDGVALKAALFGYVFQDAQLAGAPLSDVAVQKLVDEVKARVMNDGTTYPDFAYTSGPIAERGALSEMPVFNAGTNLSGADMATTYDRGREELFRRLVGLITTRGNIFTVYAAGQSLVPPPGGSAAPVVTATSQTKVTFRMDPKWNGAVPSDPFDPTSNDRFRKPDRYEIKILYVGE